MEIKTVSKRNCWSFAPPENPIYKYIVWIGGVGDKYINLEEAKIARQKWISKGYSDVVIEKIESEGK